MPDEELPENIKLFLSLRTAVAKVCVGRNSDMPASPLAWSAKDIRYFIENAEENAGARISERWVYSYLKKELPEKLPREDMLDILAQYAGYSSWRDYSKNQIHTDEKNRAERFRKPKNKLWLLVFVAALAIPLLYVFQYRSHYESIYSDKICFVDALSMLPVNQPITIQYFENQTPGAVLFLDSLGCIEYEQTDTERTILISSPYYENDTIQLHLSQMQGTQTFAVRPDYYALLMHLLVEKGEMAVNYERDVLENMLHPELKVLAIEEESGLPMALYNKQEFIRTILLSGAGMGRIRIIYLTYKNEMIYEMRYLLLNDI